MPLEITCARCGEMFFARASRQRRYCSRECYDLSRGPRLPFWERIDTTSGPDACWPWTGRSLHPFGYGVVRVAGKSVAASRRAYELTHGAIPAGLVVRHRCDNPPCCNPAHLELGTIADNNRDARERGRSFTPTEAVPA